MSWGTSREAVGAPCAQNTPPGAEGGRLRIALGSGLLFPASSWPAFTHPLKLAPLQGAVPGLFGQLWGSRATGNPAGRPGLLELLWPPWHAAGLPGTLRQLWSGRGGSVSGWPAPRASSGGERARLGEAGREHSWVKLIHIFLLVLMRMSLEKQRKRDDRA